MAETEIAMPEESTQVDSRPAFAIVEELKTKFGENFYVQATFEEFPTVWVERARVQEVLMFLRKVERPYVMLFDLSAVDERLRVHRDGLPASDFTVFYHLLSLERNSDIRIKVALNKVKPSKKNDNKEAVIKNMNGVVNHYAMHYSIMIENYKKKRKYLNKIVKY